MRHDQLSVARVSLPHQDDFPKVHPVLLITLIDNSTTRATLKMRIK